jgi:hypothetical protein
MAKPKRNTEEFIADIKKVWEDCPYDLALVQYSGKENKITLSCNVHGLFTKWPQEIKNRVGCPKCSKKGPEKGSRQTKEHVEARFANMVWNKGHIAHNRMTTVSFIKQLKLNWPDCPYDLSKINYVKNDVKVILTCSDHGDFLKWPSDALNHSGCPKCAGLVYDAIDVISRLSDMFPNYDYSDSEYDKSTKPMEVRCKIHDSIFYQSHYSKNECPECSKERRLRDRIVAGRAKDPSTLSEYEKYKKAVWKETNKTYKKYENVLGERSRGRHLDHIYSILHGFRDNINPIVLGNIVNLRIIDSKVNQSKSMNSDYTKEELMKLYEGNKI